MLWRNWSNKELPVHFIMLNPSTADETRNDPTVERCEQRARMWGYGGLIVTNVFAYRSTDPGVLKTMFDPIGLDNNNSIISAIEHSACTVCGWGENGKLLHRHDDIKELLKDKLLYALKVNKSGIPAHPLYLSYKLTPIPFLNNTIEWVRPNGK